MPPRRSRAKAAASSSAAVDAAPPPSPPPPAGFPSGTPAPSPSTALDLGLGSASPDGVAGSLKSPSAALPRRSLRLAGAASPVTTTAEPFAPEVVSLGSGHGSGGSRKGRGRRRARVSVSPASPPWSANSGSHGGRLGDLSLVGGGGGSAGAGRFMSLRSGSRIAKRQMEADALEAGKTGLGLDGGGEGGGQVHDEMLQQDQGARPNRRRRILVGGVESLQTESVPDSESESDEDCFMLGEVGIQVPVQTTGPSEVKQDVLVGGVETESVPDSESDSDKDCFMLGEVGIQMPVQSPTGPSEVKHDVDSPDPTAGVQIGTRARKFSIDSLPSPSSSVSLSSPSSSEDEMDVEQVSSKEAQSNSGPVNASVEPLRRQEARERAIRLAPKFAFFKADEDEGSEDDEAEELEPELQDWPGPFSTAAKVYEEREARLKARESNSSKLDKSINKAILWSPSTERRKPVRAAPSLTNLCLNTLADNAEGIESLGGIPDELKHKLLKMLCCSRKMNSHLLNELLCDSPTELQLSECSWLSEDDFVKTFGKCKTESLQVLQLDISGRCMPDYLLRTTLAKASNCMPMLTKISLKGNYRLSDKGLDTIISAAPSLSSLNLCECSLLTSSGIEIIANKLHSVLREIYIDDCINVDAMMILPALQKIKHLEVLSMSRIESVCDKFVNELIPVHGSTMRELGFTGCSKLTSSSIKTIGENCPHLSSIDLRNLNKLRDSAMRHLRNGCRLIKKLKLRRNTFSDKAVAQYVEQSGGCLTELTLNNIEKAGDLTALAIARKCSERLDFLDLSFCREITNEALGLIVDSCLSLRMLKLFGCTQITDIFVRGHSNPAVKIVGLEGSILEQIDRQ